MFTFLFGVFVDTSAMYIERKTYAFVDVQMSIPDEDLDICATTLCAMKAF